LFGPTGKARATVTGLLDGGDTKRGPNQELKPPPSRHNRSAIFLGLGFPNRGASWSIVELSRPIAGDKSGG
jgi:hypothetical protein